jgi:catechol 2,3-dioxygenase-like lactoylglutathione lyase family enzyme
MARPALGGVLETSLYHAHAERDDVTAFYAETLGLDEVARWDDGVAFRVGAGVLLLFDRDRLTARDSPIADHGTAGPGHACLLTDPRGLEAWRRRLADAGVTITHEHDWGGERHSIYFHDPAGNLLEIADGDLWPHPGG